MKNVVWFLLLFVGYQLPEGVGQRLLHRPLAQLALLLLFFGVAWITGRRMAGHGWQAYAMQWRAGSGRLLGLTFLLAIAAKVLALLVGGRLGVYAAAPPSGLAPLTRFGLVAGMGLVMLLPSAAEDIVTRGFWYRVLPAHWSAAAFVLLSSTVYVLNHIYRLANGPLEWLMLFCFGLAYATALARTGSLWAAIGLHWGWNAAGATLDFIHPMEVRISWGSPLLSAAVHLGLLALVLVAFRARAEAVD